MDTRRYAIVLCNGNVSQPDVLCQRLAGITAPLVIAANGGSAHADKLGLQVNVLIGDLDSVSPADRAALRSAGALVTNHPPEKDETDLELALLYAASQDTDRIIVLGMLGGRLDMTLANLLLLTHPDLHTVRIEVWNDWQTAWLIRPPGDQVEGSPGDTLSLIPLGQDATGVTTQGLQYPLDGETLAFGPARGVSNIMASRQARIEFQSGLLLLVHTPGRA